MAWETTKWYQRRWSHEVGYGWWAGVGGRGKAEEGEAGPTGPCRRGQVAAADKVGN